MRQLDDDSECVDDSFDKDDDDVDDDEDDLDGKTVPDDGITDDGDKHCDRNAEDVFNDNKDDGDFSDYDANTSKEDRNVEDVLNEHKDDDDSEDNADTGKEETQVERKEYKVTSSGTFVVSDDVELLKG